MICVSPDNLAPSYLWSLAKTHVLSTNDHDLENDILLTAVTEKQKQTTPASKTPRQYWRTEEHIFNNFAAGQQMEMKIQQNTKKTFEVKHRGEKRNKSI